MNLYIYQKYYIKYLFEDNKIQNYEEEVSNFNIKFISIKFQISENVVKNLKRSIIGGVNNLTIEELCKTLSLNNEKKRIDIYPIKTEYKSNNSEIKIREQNIIIIGHKDMLQYLDCQKATMNGIDYTYKIIPKSYSLYKLMTIYALQLKVNKSYIAAFICLKYNDYNSLIKIFFFIKSDIFIFPYICKYRLR